MHDAETYFVDRPEHRREGRLRPPRGRRLLHAGDVGQPHPGRADRTRAAALRQRARLRRRERPLEGLHVQEDQVRQPRLDRLREPRPADADARDERRLDRPVPRGADEGDALRARAGRRDSGGSRTCCPTSSRSSRCAIRLDLGTVVDSKNVGVPAVFLYDKYPGGLGFAQKAYHMIEEVLAAALRPDPRLPCEDGCPSCVGAPLPPHDAAGSRRDGEGADPGQGGGARPAARAARHARTTCRRGRSIPARWERVEKEQAKIEKKHAAAAKEESSAAADRTPLPVDLAARLRRRFGMLGAGRFRLTSVGGGAKMALRSDSDGADRRRRPS